MFRETCHILRVISSHGILCSTCGLESLAPAYPGPTFAVQYPQLRKLPVPELQHTLDELRRSLKPIAWSKSEYEAALVKIDRFANGLGPKLQQRLLQRYEQTDNWLEEWYDTEHYLAKRDSILANRSYYCESFLITA